MRTNLEKTASGPSRLGNQNYMMTITADNKVHDSRRVVNVLSGNSVNIDIKIPNFWRIIRWLKLLVIVIAFGLK